MKLLRISKIFKLRHLTLRPFYYLLNSTTINLHRSIHMRKTNFAHVLIHPNIFVNLTNHGVLLCKVKGVGVKGLYSFKNVINDVSATVNELS